MQKSSLHIHFTSPESHVYGTDFFSSSHHCFVSGASWFFFRRHAQGFPSSAVTITIISVLHVNISGICCFLESLKIKSMHSHLQAFLQYWTQNATHFMEDRRPYKKRPTRSFGGFEWRETAVTANRENSHKVPLQHSTRDR